MVESPDAYLADFNRLAGLFGGVTNKATCFYSGVTRKRAQSTVCNNCRLPSAARLDALSQVLGRERAVLVDDGVLGAAAAVVTHRIWLEGVQKKFVF